VKVDSCARNCTPAAGIKNTSTCGQELWSRFTSAIKKTGKDIVYSIVCNCDPSRGDQPWKWAADYANSWRTNIDFQVGWQAIPYLVDCQRRMAGNGSWCSANGSYWVDGKPYRGGPGDGGTPCKCSGGHAGGACLAPADPTGGPQQFSGNSGGKGGHWNDMVRTTVYTAAMNVPNLCCCMHSAVCTVCMHVYCAVYARALLCAHALLYARALCCICMCTAVCTCTAV
jgi:hypothetical protein